MNSLTNLSIEFGELTVSNNDAKPSLIQKIMQLSEADFAANIGFITTLKQAAKILLKRVVSGKNKELCFNNITAYKKVIEDYYDDLELLEKPFCNYAQKLLDEECNCKVCIDGKPLLEFYKRAIIAKPSLYILISDEHLTRNLCFIAINNCACIVDDMSINLLTIDDWIQCIKLNKYVLDNLKQNGYLSMFKGLFGEYFYTNVSAFCNCIEYVPLFKQTQKIADAAFEFDSQNFKHIDYEFKTVFMCEKVYFAGQFGIECMHNDFLIILAKTEITALNHLCDEGNYYNALADLCCLHKNIDLICENLPVNSAYKQLLIDDADLNFAVYKYKSAVNF